MFLCLFHIGSQESNILVFCFYRFFDFFFSPLQHVKIRATRLKLFQWLKQGQEKEEDCKKTRNIEMSKQLMASVAKIEQLKINQYWY